MESEIWVCGEWLGRVVLGGSVLSSSDSGYITLPMSHVSIKLYDSAKNENLL